MGNLKSYLFKKPEPVKALFLGLDAAGKTSILYSLKLGEIVTTIPTIGFNVETLQHKNFDITAWDVGLRDKTRSLYRFYLDNIQILIFVIDSNDTCRLTEAKDELHKICSEEQVKNCMLVVLANKQDLENALSVDSIKKAIDFDAISLEPKQIFGTVASRKETLDVALDWIYDNHGKETSQLTQPIEETIKDIKEISKVESWLDYFKKLTHQYLIGSK